MKSNDQAQPLSFRSRVRRSGVWYVLRFPAVFLTCSMWIAAAASSDESSTRERVPAATHLSSVSGNYSIFEETMVDMPWTEVEKAAQEGAIVLLPTAVIEEHGPHMGCGVDTYLGYLTCKLVRRELESRGIKTLIAPPFYWGVNLTTHVFPGTFTVRPETMKAVLQDILTSLKDWGFTNVFNINWHNDGTHRVTVLQSIIEARSRLRIDAYSVLSEEDVERFQLTGNEDFVVVHKSPPSDEPPQEYLNIHAEAYETGLMAAFFPDQVDVALARTLAPTNLTANDVLAWVNDPRQVTPLGYFGNPADFNAVQAKEYCEAYCELIADAIAAKLGGETAVHGFANH